MRKVPLILLAIVLCVISLSTNVLAEEGDAPSEPTDYGSNSAYYNELCGKSSSQLTADERTACQGYVTYMSSQSSSLKDQLEAIENKRTEIAANIETYAATIGNYQVEITALNTDIANINAEIAVQEKQIEEKQEEITTKEKEVTQVEEKVLSRMETAQETMRLNRFLDVIAGSSSLNDLIRRTNGINDITHYDQKTLDDLADLIQELNQIKADMEATKEEMDANKEAVVEKQNSLIYKKQEAEIITEEYRKQQADLEAEGNRIAANVEAIQAQMEEIAEKLAQVPTSAGWTRPVFSGSISEGTWHYSGGGTHLGMDFAASIGTAIHAAGNGVVINSADGCGYGQLGDWCGYQFGGSSGGGNQVYLLTSINGALYAVKYLHMNLGSPIATGTVVNAGDVIGQVGSSGNSTGPHCHVEVFYLGTMSLSSYAAKWNGDLAFGCGWGSAALGDLCENGASAPCRIKPESVFGS